MRLSIDAYRDRVLGCWLGKNIGGTLGAPDVPGDESKAYEGFPVFDHFATDEAPACPGVGR